MRALLSRLHSILVTGAIVAGASIVTSGAVATPALASSGAPDFGSNVLIFDPSMPQSQVQAAVDSVSSQQVNNQFGMLTPKSFCDMAAPADGPVSLEDLRQFFSRELAPLHHLPVRAHQGGPMVMPMDFAEQLAAVDASSPSVPVGDLRPDQAILWIRSDLTEAFLSAVLALGPAGAFS